MGTELLLTDAGATKRAAAEFWDSNPCGGGGWKSYREFLDWYRATEPYFYQILGRYEWNGVETLEVGCGQGTVVNHLAPLGACVTAIDMSERSIERALAGAREMGHEERVRLLHADAEHLPFPDASFDAALSAGVLHHTPDIHRGIAEIHRVLRPGGRLVVMLYRSGNPKWWATVSARAAFRAASKVSRRPAALLERLRQRQEEGDTAGTALLELFGVPILNACTNGECRALFNAFTDLRITNHQPGFRRLADVFPALRAAEGALGWVDHATCRGWGFYQVIEARKPG
ncbi:MAG TPA: class I SAM-dependent methyltransferase [Longimicrobium sp.]|nr:class I SAM-dependent methyltransferase [Longimicrobium sp.]